MKKHKKVFLTNVSFKLNLHTTDELENTGDECGVGVTAVDVTSPFPTVELENTGDECGVGVTAVDVTSPFDTDELENTGDEC